jgi:hypothetical protein
MATTTNKPSGPSAIQPEQNMKKKIISIIAFPLFVCAAASAQGIKGTIKVPAPATSGPFVNFGCANLVVVAESKARTGPLGSKPVWTSESKKVRGTYTAGTCRYKLAVPASPHEFTMDVGIKSFVPNIPKGQKSCDVLRAVATGLGGLWTVPKGTWKTNNFSVTELQCVIIK